MPVSPAREPAFEAGKRIGDEAVRGQVDVHERYRDSGPRRRFPAEVAPQRAHRRNPPFLHDDGELAFAARGETRGRFQQPADLDLRVPEGMLADTTVALVRRLACVDYRRRLAVIAEDEAAGCAGVAALASFSAVA